MRKIEAMPPAPAESAPKPAVLVVEDDADQSETLKAFLEGLGFGVICAANGREALARLRESVPCILLVDLFMPVMGGIELLHILRKESRYRAIPKVIMTAANDQMVGVKEDVSVLFKPIDLDEVAQAVRQCCRT